MSRTDAFHVTAATLMAVVLTEGLRTDWRGVLGTGAYFDLGSATTGLVPAQQRYPAQPLIVLRCAVQSTAVLDLDTHDMRERFQRFQRQLQQRLGRDTMRRLGHGGHVDTFLEALASVGEQYDTVQRTFVTDGLTRIAVREAHRVQVLEVREIHGGGLLWQNPTLN